MLKKDQCWRCDTICSSPSPKIPCSRCGVASYCSDECKHSDVFRHQVDCQTAALKRKCSGCGEEKTGLKPCGSCLQVWYCDKECQTKSWPTHKVHCRLIYNTTKTEELSRKLQSVYEIRKRIPSLETVYYWGNTPAVDLINLPLNEGCHYSNPLSILACGVGDARNVVLSLSQLPGDYKEELTFVLNDISACVMARTVLILYMLIKGGDQTASSVTQMWYSLRLSEKDHQLVISTLQELIQASSLEELTRGTMKIEQDQLHKLVQVWRTWLDLSSREGNWVTEARRRMIEIYPGSEEGIDFYLKQIPKEHKESASDWFAKGILLPKESRKGLTHENFTLTGNLDVFNRNEDPNKAFPFTYLIDQSVIPFTSWDYKDVKQFSYSASILKMYSQYVGHVLKKCAMTLATGQVKFHFLLCNCVEMTSFLPPDRKYDRVTTSNIADYVPLTSILDMSKPLLNTVNPSAVIITEFLNWVEHTNLTQKEKRLFDQMPESFRQKVLEDTQNPAIAYSSGRVAFMDYHDNSEELVQFLRTAVVVSEVPDERNRRRTWKSVADYNGLIARNFLRCQNQVFPAKWMINCRRVNMLSGFERAVEWIINPK